MSHRVREAFALWDVRGLWFDPSDARDDETGERFWEPVCDEWAADYGEQLEMWAVKDGDRKHAVIWDMRNSRHLSLFTEHAERFTSDVSEQTLRHDGSARLKEHAHNARRRPGRFGIGLGKEHRESARKIDAAVCAVGARMMWRLWQARPKQEQRVRTGEVWF